MGETLEVRLSEIVGKGRNLGVSFAVDKRGTDEVPLVGILLEGDRLVEIPVNYVNQRGKPRYELRADGGEALRVYPGRQVVQVVDNHRNVLCEQRYEPLKR